MEVFGYPLYTVAAGAVAAAGLSQLLRTLIAEKPPKFIPKSNYVPPPPWQIDQFETVMVPHLRKAFDSGKTRPWAWRAGQLVALRAMLMENIDTFAAALFGDVGKSRAIALGMEVLAAVGVIDDTLSRLRSWMAPEKVSMPLALRPSTGQIVREPLGVTLIIAPWNLPLLLALEPLLGAIAGGNCAIIKPSELAPRTAAALADLIPKYLDTDCITVVTGGADVGKALVALPVDHIFYTGNEKVAKYIMQEAAQRLVPVTLELGGKSPTIVDKSVNLKLAARRIAWGKTINAGQTCIAPDYVLIHRSREKEFITALQQQLHEFYGDDTRKAPDYGRIVNEQHAKRLAALLDDSGIQVVAGGEVDIEGRFISPTLVTNVSAESKMMQEEIFGPILPIISVDSMQEALDFVRTRPKPLALYVFSDDKVVQQTFIDHSSSGSVVINDNVMQYVVKELPFGGIGNSGMGKYHGKASFDAFTHPKSVLRATVHDVPVRYPPYTPFKQRITQLFFGMPLQT